MDDYSNTIVGGREGSRTTWQSHPRGIEILLKKAKADPEFRTKFLENPVEAATRIELDRADNRRAGERRREAAPLQLKFAIVNARRHIDQQNQLQTDGLLCQPVRAGAREEEEDQAGADGVYERHTGHYPNRL